MCVFYTQENVVTIEEAYESALARVVDTRRAFKQ